jgi:hypothetical protein
MQFHSFRDRKKSSLSFLIQKNGFFRSGLLRPFWDAAGDKKGAAELWKRAICRLII